VPESSPIRGHYRLTRSAVLAALAPALVVGLFLTGSSPAMAADHTAPSVTSGSGGEAPSPSGSPPVEIASDATGSVDPLQGVLDYLHTRKGVAQVALFDEVTGQTYLISDGMDRQYTASIVKADILAMWLRRYQSLPGTIPSNVPYSIQFLMQNMITMSDNVAATSLFYFGGGCTDLTAFNTLIPTHDTTVGCESPTYYGWGNTSTTAADQVAIVRTLAYDNVVLTPNARSYGLHLMESVEPTQRWGVTCGPWGSTCDAPNYADPVTGVTVALKNGWKYVPTCTKQDDSCPWQVNSMGWVQGKDRDYVLAVLTTDDPVGKDTYGFNYGIATIQGVSERIWDNLAPRPTP
jgi:Beta-lactamase enzyme family